MWAPPLNDTHSNALEGFRDSAESGPSARLVLHFGRIFVAPLICRGKTTEVIEKCERKDPSQRPAIREIAASTSKDHRIAWS